jgi:hypothetical protein
MLGGPASKIMNFVVLKTISNAECANWYGGETVISSCICTAAHKKKQICSVRSENSYFNFL